MMMSGLAEIIVTVLWDLVKIDGVCAVLRLSDLMSENGRVDI
jgi:hypothetical protein